MYKRRIGVRGIVWRNGKLLAAKHKNKDGSEAAYWAIPGGGLDPGESLIAGVKREFLEETGIHAAVGKLLFVQQFPNKKDDRDEELEFFFHIENSNDFDTIDLQNTTHGAAEISRIAFIDPTKELLLPDFIATTPIHKLIEQSSDAQIHSYL